MSKNIFNSVKMFRPKTNTFDMSHSVKLSLNMGELVPIMCMECVPTDRVQISTESLLRLAPLVAPVMDSISVTFHYFFVPHRITWPSWQQFIDNEKIPLTNLLPAFPFLNMHSVAPTPTYTRLADYLGLPLPLAGTGEYVSALPFAAYQKIFDEYYRDENLQIAATDRWIPLVDGDNTANVDKFNILRTRAWEHDYFTSALPFAQKGDAVDMPLGEVRLKSAGVTASRPGQTKFATTHAPLTGAHTSLGVTGDTQTGGIDSVYDPNGTLESTAGTINTFRRAVQLQKWLEKMARGGTRNFEVLAAHFGLKSKDQRLQRPEYICGTKSPVVISEIPATNGGPQALGTLAGHGISVTNGANGSYFCEEHGYIIGIMNVQPKTSYQQGIARHWLKRDNTDFFWPDFANLSEQAIQNRELFAYDGAGTGSDTFGYIPRYAEYKFENNRVAGDFKTTLNYWHFGRIFAALPSLNATFIKCVPRHDAFAVTDPTVQKLYAHVQNTVKANRPMPKYGTPTL